MSRKLITSIYSGLLLLAFQISSGQNEIYSNPDKKPDNIGGKEQLEHIVKTQLYLAPNYIWKDEKNLTIFFTVTKDGKVVSPFFKEKLEPFYENECKRMLKYFEFIPGTIGGVNVDAYGSLNFLFSGPKYDESLKERKKLKKLITKPQDSTFTIYEMADVSPEFYKGADELSNFILENIEYPNVAKNQNIEGTVPVTFIIETNGFVSNVKALKTVNGGCSEEAVRVTLMTKWKPAEKNGKLVRYRMTIPIVFNLKNVNKDNSASGQ